MHFRDIILVEGLGNLKDLPKSFIKTIIRNIGGENSKLELYKSNAKRSDVTKAAKLIAGVQEPTKKITKEEIEEYNKKYAAVVIKVDGKWAYLVEKDIWDSPIYTLTGVDGEVTKSAYNSKRFYSTNALKATDISDRIDFENSIIDVFLVTRDTNRLKKQEDRKNKRDNGLDNIKKEAIRKFLKLKSNDIENMLKEDLKESTKKIEDSIKTTIENISNGIYDTSALDGLEEEIKNIQDKVSPLKQLSSWIEKVMEDGRIINWGSNKTYAYDRFKEVIDGIKAEIEKD